MKKETKNGITLTILLVTIVLMIILAGSSIYFFTQNNTIDDADEVVIRNDIQVIKDQYELLMEEYNFEKYGHDYEIDSKKFEDIIPDDYKDSFRADVNGIYYFGTNPEVKEIAEDMQIIIEEP